MPIFEYECAKCGKTFEVVILPGSRGRIKCPRCGSRRARKIMSGFSVISPEGTGQAKGSGSEKTSGACRTCGSKRCSTCG